MKYCRNCGAEIDDEAVVCVKCGCAVEQARPASTQISDSSTLRTIAKIFMIIGCVSSAFGLLIPLCWTIPMTLKYCRAVKENQPVSIAFKVCSLLFVNTIAGILMLLDNDNV